MQLPGLLFKSFLLSLLLLAVSAACYAETIRIAAASNFIEPMKALTGVFQDKTSHRVKVSYASSGKLFAQISQGAPFDVFLSADQDKPSRLISSGLAIPESRFSYARGQLALVASDSESLPGINNAQALQDLLRSGSYHKLAIANPKHAPYGLAAKRYLQQADLWQLTEQKLVYGENIAQTYQFVFSGNAGLGLVARSQLKDGDDFWLLPANKYPAILQDAVLLTSAQDNIAATAFIDFLKSDQARELIWSYGYHAN